MPVKTNTMATTKAKFETVNEYIGSFPREVQTTLQKIRQTIKKAEPDAEEVISYQIPAFKLHGFLVYFSAYKEHYSITFPPPFTVFEAFKKELAPYQLSKTTVQLPMKQPIPFDLITNMVKFRAKENLETEKKKKKK
jgi:uncharacterized protein YdhG (YjbR/CyaY superfamily)